MLSSLFSLARESHLEAQRDAMYRGDHINTSEDRAVLHIALRNIGQGKFDIKEEGADEVEGVLARMKEFTDKVRSGEHKG